MVPNNPATLTIGSISAWFDTEGALIAISNVSVRVSSTDITTSALSASSHTAVNNAGVVGLTGYVLRYDPVARAFKSLLGDGRLGQLLHVRVEAGSYLPDWRPEQDFDSGMRKTVLWYLDRWRGAP